MYKVKESLREIYILPFVLGGMGARRHANYTVDSSERNYPESSNHVIVQWSPFMVSSYKGSSRSWSWMVHVPGEYGSNEESSRLRTSCR